MSEALRKAEELEQYAAFYGGAVEQVMRSNVAELRRLAAVEQELIALLRAISDAEPVGTLESDPYEGHIFVPTIEDDWSMLGTPLYTLKGIKP